MPLPKIQMPAPKPQRNPEDKQKFLDIMKMIESSGGRNFNHSELKGGMHKGHRAIGSYGFMPNTVQEMVKRMRTAGIPISDELRQASRMNPQEMKEYMENNLGLEEELADYMADFVLDRFDGDMEKAAWAWEHGHNTKKDRFESNNYQDSARVSKFRRYAAQDRGPSSEPEMSLEEYMAARPNKTMAEPGQPVVGAVANPYTKPKDDIEPKQKFMEHLLNKPEELAEESSLPTEENTPSRFRKIKGILGQPT
jgi:hypothetical protein